MYSLENEIWNHGYSAYEAGYSLEDNPFSHFFNPNASAIWENGWIDAEEADDEYFWYWPW